MEQLSIDDGKPPSGVIAPPEVPFVAGGAAIHLEECPVFEEVALHPSIGALIAVEGQLRVAEGCQVMSL
jgi:hypothetical protein